MSLPSSRSRPLGTMVAYGFPEKDVGNDLALAQRLGATVLEVLPDWRSYPDPAWVRDQAGEAGLAIHSAHGCWGGQSIRAPRVDLGQTQPAGHAASVDDLKRCIDWLQAARGTYLIVHPGGLSDPEQLSLRRDTLARGLIALADHARGTGVIVCVENMPPGVYPGSRMADLVALVGELARAELGLALDTGHAHISADVVSETLAAGRWLRTTHVHDNEGRQDVHLPPGLGTIDWTAWADALGRIEYRGTIMLECIRYLREHPEVLTNELRDRLARLTGGS